MFFFRETSVSRSHQSTVERVYFHSTGDGICKSPPKWLYGLGGSQVWFQVILAEKLMSIRIVVSTVFDLQNWIQIIQFHTEWSSINKEEWVVKMLFTILYRMKIWRRDINLPILNAILRFFPCLKMLFFPPQNPCSLNILITNYYQWLKKLIYTLPYFTHFVILRSK